MVTGAAHGENAALGVEYVKVLAAEGAKVVGADLKDTSDVAQEIEDAGGEALALNVDVRDEAQVNEMVANTIDHFGSLEILINNTAIGSNIPQIPVTEMSVEDWDYTLRLNLRGTFLCTRFAAPHMMARRQGRIVCLSSGSREGTPWTALSTGGAAYSVSKAGVHGFIRDVAIDLADYNITVNAVAPGPIDTDRVGPGLRKLEETMTLGPMTVTPLGRLGLPEEVANAILFLLSDEASYISGHTLAVSGGR